MESEHRKIGQIARPLPGCVQFTPAGGLSKVPARQLWLCDMRHFLPPTPVLLPMQDGNPLRRRRTLAAWAAILFLGALPRLSASADPSPIKIAVFDFELDDVSAGAGIAGDPAADLAQLQRTTNEARRLITQSGRYTLVDVSSAKGRPLRQCSGCEAAIALKLGADQSFVGVVSRISRTEYTVRFQVRDARTGALVLASQSDLRIGADYSWYRGAASLINDRLLNNG